MLTDTDKKFLRIAYEEAKAGYDEGGCPIGSVLARGDRLVSQGRNQRVQGGNLQKVILSRALAGDAKVVVANQPTRGLDVGAVGFVHQQLLEARRKGAAILLISEDLDEVLSLSDRICVMYRGKLSEPMWRSEVKFADIGLMMAGQTPEKKAGPHAA